MKNKNPIDLYLHEIEKIYKSGKSTEHSFRSSLQIFLESIGRNITALNEPKRVNCGAPDFIISQKRIPIGYIEAKDISENLNKIEKSDQLNRYLTSLSNLLLTDYLEFRWYVNGEKRLSIKLADLKNGHIKKISDDDSIYTFFNAFFNAELPVIKTAEELALRLANSSKSIRSLIIEVFKLEPSNGWLHKWLKAFSEVLISELDNETFADMFSQTLAYGFFAARIHHDNKVDFSRFETTRILPKTNPFLRQLFAQFAGPNMPDEINWAVDEIVELLKRTDVESIKKSFQSVIGKEDPIIHFYETFLTAYNAKLREQRGVYYTPEPVVSYIVRSVDEIIKKDFKKKNGLADDKTLVLDPAVGTASFLKKVIEIIFEKFESNMGAWDAYVEENLLERIFGFEILMAPYSVAHLKLGLQLQETGYTFQKNQRLGVYLTNTLEAAAKKSEEMLFEWISDEANSASAIKKEKPIMVVLGNPPYSSESANNGKWISDLLHGYDSITNTKTTNYFECEGQPLGERNPRWINDDYVKFIRFSQWRIEQTGHGILAFVTNHGFLDNPTFRGMRESLLETFDELYVLDLHGNVNKKEISPNGEKDQNVFDIQQGVCINFFIKKQSNKLKTTGSVFKADLWGERKEKYKWLCENSFLKTNWIKIEPKSPYYLFIEQDSNRWTEYQKFWKLTDVFPVNSAGIIAGRDNLALHFTEHEAWETINEFRKMKTEDARLKWDLGEDARDWKVSLAQQDLNSQKLSKENIQKILYRPFDTRYTYYTSTTRGFLRWPKAEVMVHMLRGSNIALATARSNKSQNQNQFFVSKYITEAKTAESTTQSSLFPLYIYDDPNGFKLEKENRKINISDEYLEALKHYHGKKDIEVRFFNYVYAIVSSIKFREYYSEFLRMDFPSIPVVQDKKIFNKLSIIGLELIKLHTMENLESNSKFKFPVKGSSTVEFVKYDESTNQIRINQSQYFTNISSEIWNYEIGGYQVVLKWLKSRVNRILSFNDIVELQSIFASIEETIRLQIEIDSLIFTNNKFNFGELIKINPSQDEINKVRERIDILKQAITKKQKKKKSA